ncbi:MAG: AmmeMemoRadiSam system radical SAM enzyme [Methanobacteriota archaeon]|nr:MAG: AmmeMemoRadiSam system radical SAM enzyme [Euryarchaeota archaeon]
MEVESCLYEKLPEGKVRCRTCAWRCTIKEGKRGFCGVRENRGGRLYALNYGIVSSANVDPIEKKPLFHFYPGSYVFSLGTVGCNFRCLHCQNYQISQASLDESIRILAEYTPEQTIEMAKRYGCRGMAWTYNEPTIWFEYTYDSARLAKAEGLYTVYVTNGYMTADALERISPYLDAMNIDVKGFTEGFYRSLCKTKLAPVLETVERAHNLGIHIELTYLIIPTYNDSIEEISRFADWVAKVDPNIPVHFSRFHPDYRLTDAPMTPTKTLEEAWKRARERLSYVYIGNVPGHEGENTTCPECGATLIERVGYSTKVKAMKDGRCQRCGARVPGSYAE